MTRQDPVAVVPCAFRLCHACARARHNGGHYVPPASGTSGTYPFWLRPRNHGPKSAILHSGQIMTWHKWHNSDNYQSQTRAPVKGPNKKRAIRAPRSAVRGVR